MHAFHYHLLFIARPLARPPTPASHYAHRHPSRPICISSPSRSLSNSRPPAPRNTPSPFAPTPPQAPTPAVITAGPAPLLPSPQPPSLTILSITTISINTAISTRCREVVARHRGPIITSVRAGRHLSPSTRHAHHHLPARAPDERTYKRSACNILGTFHVDVKQFKKGSVMNPLKPL